MDFEARNNRGSPESELDKIKNLIQLIDSRGFLSKKLDFPKIWFKVLLDLEEFSLYGKEHENRIVAYTLCMAVTGKAEDLNSTYKSFREVFGH